MTREGGKESILWGEGGKGKDLDERKERMERILTREGREREGSGREKREKKHYLKR